MKQYEVDMSYPVNQRQGPDRLTLALAFRKQLLWFGFLELPISMLPTLKEATEFTKAYVKQVLAAARLGHSWV